MHISEEKIGGVLAVRLSGRLDATTSKSVEDHLVRQIDAGERVFVVDLAHLDYISSIGLRVFMMAAKRLKVLQGRIVVCSMQPPIRQVFEVSGFTTFLPTYADRDAAIKGLQ